MNEVRRRLFSHLPATPSSWDELHIGIADLRIRRGILTVRLSPIEHLLARALLTAPLLSVRDLVDVLYGEREDGGPETAENSVSVALCRCRQKLALLGIEFRNSFAWGYSAVIHPKRYAYKARGRACNRRWAPKIVRVAA